MLIKIDIVYLSQPFPAVHADDILADKFTEPHSITCFILCSPLKRFHCSISFFRVRMAFFSNRETCACEMPSSLAISIWVMSS